MNHQSSGRLGCRIGRLGGWTGRLGGRTRLLGGWAGRLGAVGGENIGFSLVFQGFWGGGLTGGRGRAVPSAVRSRPLKHTFKTNHYHDHTPQRTAQCEERCWRLELTLNPHTPSRKARWRIKQHNKSIIRSNKVDVRCLDGRWTIPWSQTCFCYDSRCHKKQKDLKTTNIYIYIYVCVTIASS